jgi:L-Ala-D/L-Glu epimerase
VATRVTAHRTERWPLSRPFVTSDNVIDAVEVVVVEIAAVGHVGRGEATGIYFRGETASSMRKQIEDVRHALDNGLTRLQLQSVLPPGGARNAIDCALWELDSKLSHRSLAEYFDLSDAPIQTVATVCLAEPSHMATEAMGLAHFPILKIKLDDRQPVQRIQAIREARPDARLIVDVNGGWSHALLMKIANSLAELQVEMIEQPCAPRDDADLRQADVPVPLCADESCCTASDLPYLAARYSMINIKLDKTGGLTEALSLADAAADAGFGLMVGNMIGTSLAMAPASALAPRCRYVDLDGPLLLMRDRSPGIRVQGSFLGPLIGTVWG